MIDEEMIESMKAVDKGHPFSKPFVDELVEQAQQLAVENDAHQAEVRAALLAINSLGPLCFGNALSRGTRRQAQRLVSQFIDELYLEFLPLEAQLYQKDLSV
jgi:hypothetical protein